jgi:hypothetical protein
MTRKTLQSMFCLLLSPLLVAQLVSQEAEQPVGEKASDVIWAYPASGFDVYGAKSALGMKEYSSETPVELVPVNPLEFADATVGATIHFRLAKALVAGGRTVLLEGTPIEGRITKLREGKLRTHNGRQQLPVEEVYVLHSFTLRLQTKKRSHGLTVAKRVLVWTGRGVALAALSPLFAIDLIGWTVVILGCKDKDGC